MIGDEQKQAVEPPRIPASIETLVSAHSWAQRVVGKGGAAVYRLDRCGTPSLYLKCGHGAVAQEIADEVVRLRWLQGLAPVPDVRQFVTTGEQAWLLTTAVPGQTAQQLLEKGSVDPIGIVDLISGFTRRFHSD
jgi:aminoglycoside 3'-phosphotransferase I